MSSVELEIAVVSVSVVLREFHYKCSRVKLTGNDSPVNMYVFGCPESRNIGLARHNGESCGAENKISPEKKDTFRWTYDANKIVRIVRKRSLSRSLT